MGAELNFPSVETAKARSGHVTIIAYISFPTIDMYLVVSSLSNCESSEAAVDDAATSLVLLSRGTFMPLQDVMLNSSSVSSMYLRWCRRIVQAWQSRSI